MSGCPPRRRALPRQITAAGGAGPFGSHSTGGEQSLSPEGTDVGCPEPAVQAPIPPTGAFAQQGGQMTAPPGPWSIPGLWTGEALETRMPPTHSMDLALWHSMHGSPPMSAPWPASTSAEAQWHFVPEAAAGPHPLPAAIHSEQPAFVPPTPGPTPHQPPAAMALPGNTGNPGVSSRPRDGLRVAPPGTHSPTSGRASPVRQSGLRAPPAPLQVRDKQYIPDKAYAQTYQWNANKGEKNHWNFFKPNADAPQGARRAEHTQLCKTKDCLFVRTFMRDYCCDTCSKEGAYKHGCNCDRLLPGFDYNPIPPGERIFVVWHGSVYACWSGPRAIDGQYMALRRNWGPQDMAIWEALYAPPMMIFTEKYYPHIPQNLPMCPGASGDPYDPGVSPQALVEEGCPNPRSEQEWNRRKAEKEKGKLKEEQERVARAIEEGVRAALRRGQAGAILPRGGGARLRHRRR